METMGVSERRCLQNFEGRRSAKSLIFWEKTGAGEGIRTLDPNLGNFEISLRYDSILHDIHIYSIFYVMAFSPHYPIFAV